MSKSNSNYPDKPGYGTFFFQDENQKKHPSGPDFTGHVVLEIDYKAGERVYIGLWQKQTRVGTTMLSAREDNWLKKKKLEEGQPREVTPAYAKKPNTFNRSRDDGGDVPF